MLTTSTTSPPEDMDDDQASPTDVCVCVQCLHLHYQRKKGKKDHTKMDQDEEDARAQTPYQGLCGHVFCYTCAAQLKLEGLSCPRCQRLVEDLIPLPVEIARR